MNADGSRPHAITQQHLPATGEDSQPQWSPDGQKLLFDRLNVRTATPADGFSVWTIDLRRHKEHRMTPYRLRGGDTPDWSPDSRHILFRSNGDRTDLPSNIYTVRANGTHLKQLTFATGDTVYLGSSYSPDGRWITFGRKPATGGSAVNAADVFIMRVDGSDVRPVTRTDLYDSLPDWGSRICSKHS